MKVRWQLLSAAVLHAMVCFQPKQFSTTFQIAHSHRSFINRRLQQNRDLHGTLACQCRDLGATFKWVFFGTTNTDTAIFVDAAQNIVRDLDHNVPYFLSGDSAQQTTTLLVRTPQAAIFSMSYDIP